MKKSIGWCVGLALVLPIVLGLATAQAAEETTPPFLYVLSAKKVKIEAVDGGDYTLDIKKAQIQHVLEISEKPFKLVNHISSDRIVETWKTGAGDFGEGITMKGTILAAGQAIAAINIKSIAKTDTVMRFVFFLDETAALDPSQLGTLKQVIIVNYCCHPEGGSGEWLWGQ